MVYILWDAYTISHNSSSSSTFSESQSNSLPPGSSCRTGDRGPHSSRVHLAILALVLSVDFLVAVLDSTGKEQGEGYADDDMAVNLKEKLSCRIPVHIASTSKVLTK